MFKNLFNIGITPKAEPVLEETPVRKARKPRSIKANAEKVLSELLDRLENVNNPKVDSLRTLFISLEKGDNLDVDKLVAYYKEPIPVKSKGKKKQPKAEKQVSCGSVKWTI